MIIDSTFRDYYDNIADSIGVDHQCIYNRSTREWPVTNLPNRVDKWYDHHDDLMKDWLHENIHGDLLDPKKKIFPGDGMFILAFCGRVFTGWKGTHVEEQGEIAWTAEQYREVRKRIQDRSASRKIRSYRHLLPDWKITTSEWLDIPEVESHLLNHWFSSPVVMISIRTGWNNAVHDLVNDRDQSVIATDFPLTEIQFQKQMDPWTAFQSIHQYISGVIGSPTRETVEVSDQDMRDAKGFDGWSFKNRGTAKKRKRNK